jgi:aminopeptidase N
MQTYFNKYRYGIAYVDDLLSAAETQLDRKTIDDLMTKWITTPN